jgi:hypothetical protein
MKQDFNDLCEHLKEQIEFLNISCVLFDRGRRSEAKRIAATLAILLHDTRTSHSLLNQLGMKNMQFCDTGAATDEMHSFMQKVIEKEVAKRKKEGKRVGQVVGSTGGQRLLIPAVMNGRSGIWIPKLQEGLKGCHFLPFQEWWNQHVVSSSDGILLSRKELILSIRNKVGGAHIDPELDNKYASLTKEAPHTLQLSISGKVIEEHGPEFGTVRQIAYELLVSFRQEIEKLQLDLEVK